MNKRPLLHSLEFPSLIAYLLLWLLLSTCHRMIFEMHSDAYQQAILIWASAISFPIVLYASKRSGDIDKVKWYGYIGYFLSYMLVFTYITQSMIAQGKLLLFSAQQQEITTSAKVIEVRKIFKRKMGFDHTKVTLSVDGKQMILQARPYAYFYLHDKQNIISLGNSPSGPYVTSSHLSKREKLLARWSHLQDQFHRNRMIAFFLLPVGLGLWLALKYSPDQKKVAGNKPNVWKTLGLALLLIIGFFILVYIALSLYTVTSS